ncbi:MAG TPA: AI-2E family transporter, partial [Novosphingobium sp.]|nr:AI-2E family transporter [Novosphingobium sp.]
SLAIASSLVAEAATIYERIRSGQIDLGRIAENFRTQLPPWVHDALNEADLTDLRSIQDTLGTSISTGLQQIASQALWVGQGALSFLASLGIMLYLTFFLLRDGRQLGLAIARAVPLRAELRDELVRNFIVVVRATMKGSVVIAIIQGFLGGMIFWFLGIEGAILWGLLMGFFSLVPAIGTGIVWVPVSIYLFVTGAIWQGAVLVGCGVFIIGLIDNLLRPILVGHDTRMPDFVVLISTLAGINLFGLSGFIIGPVIAALFIAVWKLVGELRERGAPPA